MPESMWKSYIDFEAVQGDFDRGRALFARLLERTQHVKVFIALATFELEAVDGGVSAARKAYLEANTKLKELQLKEERVLLLNAWRDMEANAGDQGDLAAVEALMPKKIKMRRAVSAEEGGDTGHFEEYYEYSFPDDVKKMPGLKILENAMKWKAMLKQGGALGGIFDGTAGAAGAAGGGAAAAGAGDSSLKATKAPGVQAEEDANELDIDDL